MTDREMIDWLDDLACAFDRAGDVANRQRAFGIRGRLEFCAESEQRAYQRGVNDSAAVCRIRASHASIPVGVANEASKCAAQIEHNLLRSKHYHVNSGDGSDTCKSCGLDLRDDIHHRIQQ